MATLQRKPSTRTRRRARGTQATAPDVIQVMVTTKTQRAPAVASVRVCVTRAPVRQLDKVGVEVWDVSPAGLALNSEISSRGSTGSAGGRFSPRCADSASACASARPSPSAERPRHLGAGGTAAVKRSVGSSPRRSRTRRRPSPARDGSARRYASVWYERADHDRQERLGQLRHVAAAGPVGGARDDDHMRTIPIRWRHDGGNDQPPSVGRDAQRLVRRLVRQLRRHGQGALHLLP